MYSSNIPKMPTLGGLINKRKNTFRKKQSPTHIIMLPRAMNKISSRKDWVTFLPRSTKSNSIW